MEGKNIKTVEIPYFDGLNSSVGQSLSKIQELTYSENARSKVIGTIEKREGTVIVGSALTATKNLALFYFKNDYNKGLYRISKVAGVTSIYYLNNSDTWTALTGFGTKVLELGDSTTRFDTIANAGGDTWRYTWVATGTDPDIDHHLRVGTILVINAQNFLAANNGTFTIIGVGANYFDVTNTAGVADTLKTIGTGSIYIDDVDFSVTVAESRCFIVNGHNDNMYIDKDGTTVVASATPTTGYLWGSPKAHKINYYKGKLYLSDYIYAGDRYKNGILFSSPLMGIVALVDGDYPISGVPIKINVTDTKYIHASDTLLVYRGNSLKDTWTVTAKTEYSITVSATTVVIESADELWIDGTYSGEKTFRWVDVPATGVEVKEYDTFKLTGGQTDEVNMLANIGDVELIANTNSMAVWNGTSLQNIDLGIGCVSPNGYIKHLGVMYFVHYTGMYASGGGVPQIESLEVERYFTGATRSGLENACMGKKGYSIFCHIGDVTLYYPDGSAEKTLIDVVLEKNMKQGNWYVHTGIKATQFATYIESTNPDKFCFSSKEANFPILEFLNGMTDYATSTTTRQIPFRIDTKPILLSNRFWKIGNPLEAILETERGSGLECFVSLDSGSFYAIGGVAEKGCTIFKINSKNEDVNSPPRCRRIKLSIRDFTSKLCKISMLAINFIQTLEEEQSKPENYGK